MLEVSAGGVVIHNGEFLLLKKFSNEWVLPKGRLENKKTVHYFYMEPEDLNLIPQREEGFVEAIFLPYDKAMKLVKHDAERNMLKSANYFYEKRKRK